MNVYRRYRFDFSGYESQEYWRVSGNGSWEDNSNVIDGVHMELLEFRLSPAITVTATIIATTITLE